MATFPELIPVPTSVRPADDGGTHAFGNAWNVCLPAACELDLLWALRDGGGLPWNAVDAGSALLRFELHGGMGDDQAYRIEVGEHGMCIQAGGAAGWFHGGVTLTQWLRGTGPIRGVVIEDRPALQRRGYMLDVSRDRMPTMGELRRLIDQLARLKYNHLELYLEHAFAYEGHAVVHENSSPITPAEMREIVSYAARRAIELVPNQNTFGHMHRWLIHPEYKHLAEQPEGMLHAFHFEKEPFGLCAANPKSLELVDDMLGQLLPLFDSPFFNAGMDETIDLGDGGSQALCEERGKGGVYMDYLLAVQKLTAKHGKRMVFWADILLEHPEVFNRLPGGSVPVLWGYEKDHPLAGQARILHGIGAEFWIAPGTSSWQSLTGRYSNCLGNISHAAQAALEHGASALVLTDWGDYGHWQPPSLSNLAILHFAAQAWSGPEHAAPDADAINCTFYGGRELQLAQAWMQLWQASDSLQDGALNGTSPFYAMRYPPHCANPEGEWQKRCSTWTLQGAEAYDGELDRALATLDGSGSAHSDAQELSFSIRIAHWANQRAKERGQGLPVAADADSELLVIERELAALWRLRSRPGGLEDSLLKLRFALHPGGVRS